MFVKSSISMGEVFGGLNLSNPLGCYGFDMWHAKQEKIPEWTKTHSKSTNQLT